MFKEVLGVFTESFKGGSRKIKGYFKEVSRVFQESFREMSRMYVKKAASVFQEKGQANVSIIITNPKVY